MSVLPWTVVLLTLALVLAIRFVPRRQHRLFDRMYLSMLLCFCGLAVVQLLDTHVGLRSPVRQLTYGLIYQLLVFFVTLFLLALLPRRQRRLWPLAWVHGLLGGLLLLLQAAPLLPDGRWWEGFNILFGAGFLLVLLLALWRDAPTRSWMVLLVAFAGFWVMLSDFQSRSWTEVPTLSWAQVSYNLMLALLWLYAARHIRPARPTADRRQLALDLHDGVGSQLSTLISGLDQSTPQGRQVVLALQECLLELKLLVDDMHEEHSVVELLACLRYRMESMLALASMDLAWELVGDEQLERVMGTPAREILRIAQEALANAVRHAQASAVQLSLCYIQERDCLLLEIVDNGIGLERQTGADALLESSAEGMRQGSGRSVAAPCAKGRPGGQGLHGMRSRARRLGGRLYIGVAHPQGTRIVLQVPMARLLEWRD